MPDSTVVTQYRLDKVGRRWCRQDDITLSDRQVGRERPPTRRYGRLVSIPDAVDGPPRMAVLVSVRGEHAMAAVGPISGVWSRRDGR